MKLVEFAFTMSYRDARREYETTTGIRVPKRTVHSFVQELATPLLETSRTAAEDWSILRARYPKAAGFIERNTRFMVTFAELALEGMRIPYTTNRI